VLRRERREATRPRQPRITPPRREGEVEGEGEDDNDGGEVPVIVPPPSSSIAAFRALLLFCSVRVTHTDRNEEKP
jgi:hypothetical protein